METSIQSLSCAKLPRPLFHSTGTAAFVPYHCLPRKLITRKKHSTFGAIHASVAADGQNWLLEPVGDGDSKHIGFKVPMPGALEIVSNMVTVGRVPEKADVVIPVATVSALHARIEKKEGSLLVTDLDSTNGTFIDDKRLSPGVAATVSPGRLITFGDTNLAIFRVLKIENTKVSADTVESEAEIGAEVASYTAENTS